jgi:S-adenosylmethionine:tRNA ribosyltransferase-isomerase
MWKNRGLLWKSGGKAWQMFFSCDAWVLLRLKCRHMDPKSIYIADYDYDLPDARIALHPLPERDASRLLVWRREGFVDSHYREIGDWLPSGAQMVFNDTRVTDARLRFPVKSGKDIEVFVLEPADGTMLPEILGKRGPALCRCLVGGAARWKSGTHLEKSLSSPWGDLTIRAWNEGRDGDTFRIRISWDPADALFAEVLHLAGQIPLPPYLRRNPLADDAGRYQTVYAAREGSVAAPTAGLHFTEALLQHLDGKGIRKRFVTLHVGAGTFLPVKAERMEAHPMHGEFAEVERGLLDRLREKEGPIIAVGTTSLRTLESLYWLGRKLLAEPTLAPAKLEVGQWEPYGCKEASLPGMSEALGAVAGWMDAQGRKELVFRTHLLIAPGYRFRVAEGLVTNFHQPRSTLLLLIAAWMGRTWKDMYQHALDNDYRFLSYGDGCLLGPPLPNTGADN